MTTLTQLITECRNTIGDTSGSPVISDTQLTYWINHGIADLSQYFPKRLVYAISTTANDRQYDLETDFLGVISVEYPTGDDPPSYLKRRDHKHPDFWEEDGYYDILLPHDADASNPPQIYISQKPTTGQTITINYMAAHSVLSSGSDSTSLPDRYSHLLTLYVRWRVWQELSATEGMNPDPIKLLSATQEVNSTRAERIYRKALDEAVRQAQVSESLSASWPMDANDRIY